MNVNVSDLNRFEYCPRIIYLTSVLKAEPKLTMEQVRGLVGHYVRKELSFRQARVLGKVKSPGELDGLLHRELDSLISDVPFIYREKWSGECDRILPEVRVEVYKELAFLKDKLGFLLEELGFDKALRTVTPWKTEYSIRSEVLGLNGRVDKVMREEHLIPIEIKTGSPSEGVWEGDRIQVCAYCMLLEERFKENVPSGFVEYTRVQEKRPVMASEKLRRSVIYTRDEVHEIMEGKVPDVCPHGNGRKCESCSLKDVCYAT